MLNKYSDSDYDPDSNYDIMHDFTCTVDCVIMKQYIK